MVRRSSSGSRGRIRPAPGRREAPHRGGPVQLGIFAFPTDTSLPVPDLARAIEGRGFHSMWVPDHSHIPTSRRTPPGGRRGAAGQKLPAEYLRNLDPFGALAAAAAVTDRILLGT